MTDSTTTGTGLVRASFTLERDYKASPEKAFEAFADPEIKKMWFGASDEWEALEKTYDFREGGREIDEGRHHQAGYVSRFEATYRDIVPNERIVYDYMMHVNGQKLSVSLASIEFVPTTSGGTHLTLSEYGVWFSHQDEDPRLREQGTAELLDALGRQIDS